MNGRLGGYAACDVNALSTYDQIVQNASANEPCKTCCWSLAIFVSFTSINSGGLVQRLSRRD